MWQEKTRQTPQQPSFSSSSSSANQILFWWTPICRIQMVKYQLPMGLRNAARRRGGGQQSSWWFWIYLGRDSEKNCKIEVYAGMAERLVRDLAIEEALQDAIIDTLKHNNQSYVDWCALSDKEKIRTRWNLPLHMTWAGRRDHLGRDMTPPVDTPSSLVQGARGSSEWSSIPRPAGSLMLQKIE